MLMGPAVDRYESAQSLARVASAPLVVCELIFTVTEGDRQHIAMIRDGRGDAETWAERYAIIWVARQFTHHSFPEIGRALASDHSSVLRGYNRAKLLYRTDREFRALAANLVKHLPRRRRVQKGAREIMEGVRR